MKGKKIINESNLKILLDGVVRFLVVTDFGLISVLVPLTVDLFDLPPNFSGVFVLVSLLLIPNEVADLDVGAVAGDLLKSLLLGAPDFGEEVVGLGGGDTDLLHFLVVETSLDDFLDLLDGLGVASRNLVFEGLELLEDFLDLFLGLNLMAIFVKLVDDELDVFGVEIGGRGLRRALDVGGPALGDLLLGRLLLHLRFAFFNFAVSLILVSFFTV